MPISASDPVGAALSSALDGLAYRQQVAADDIANVDTPHYRARTVQFEDALRSAVADGSVTRGPVTASTELSTELPGADGNNVDLAAETMTAMKATYAYQLVTRAVGDRFSLVSTAVGGM